LKDKKTVKIISLGGGPGIELYACRVFMKQTMSLDCELTSLDLVKDWEQYSSVLDCNFIRANFCTEDILSKIDHDLVVLCYVLKYFPPHLLPKLTEKKNIILANDGFKNLKSLNDGYRECLFNPELQFVPLVGEYDYRQCIIASKEFAFSSESKLEVTFPNVPYTFSIRDAKRRGTYEGDFFFFIS
jgi:hypothetical protein